MIILRHSKQGLKLPYKQSVWRRLLIGFSLSLEATNLSYIHIVLSHVIEVNTFLSLWTIICVALLRMIDMTVFDRVKNLADRRGMSIADVEEKVGMGKNAIYKWKRQNAATDKLELVADYFGVSTDYLLGRTSNENGGPVYTETDLARMVDSAMSFDGKPISPHDKEVILAFLKGKYGIE